MFNKHLQLRWIMRVCAVAGISGCTGLIDGEAITPPSAESAVAGTARFGVAYIVPERAGDWASTGWRTASVQAAFNRDLVILSALGVRNVKLPIEPSFTGLDFNPGSAVVSPSELAAATTAIPEIVRRFAEVGISTELTFLTNGMMLRSGPLSFNDPTRPNDYEISYGALGIPAGPQRMARDLYGWETSIISAVTAAGLGAALDYVNVATEVSYTFQRAGGVRWDQVSPHLVQALATMPAVPSGKRAADVLFPDEAPALARDLAAQGVTLDVSEIHTYVTPQGGVNPDIVAAVRAVRGAFPGTRVVIGEFGAELCDNGGDEDVQAQAFVRAIGQADSASVDLFTNWGLWDYNANGCPGSGGHWGFGYTADRPRNSMGRLVERQSALPGGNFETDLSGWSGGGTTAAVALIHGGPNRGDAATNQRYLRLQAGAPGTYWACSPAFRATGTHVAISAYLRTSSQRPSIGVHYRDAAGWSYATNRSPATMPLPAQSAWAWQNVQSMVGGKVVQVPASTQEAIVCFVMDAAAAPTYFDLDALSVNSY
jgi:hypothetical protein